MLRLLPGEIPEFCVPEHNGSKASNADRLFRSDGKIKYPRHMTPPPIHCWYHKGDLPNSKVESLSVTVPRVPD